MPPVMIPVSGGRVTSRDASLLQPGELRVAQDAEYRPYNPAIWKIRGRSEFNSSAESAALRGGAFLEFDADADNLFVVMHGAAYRKATAGLTGAFSDLAGWDSSNYALLGTATTLDSVHYSNQHVLLNGVDRNRLVRRDGTQMFHGMIAATNAPGVVSGGALTGFTLSSGKSVIYWIEERVKEGGVIIKRSATSAAMCTTLTGAGALVKPRIYLPPLANADTTHWAVYATSASTAPAFPVGAEIAEAAISTTFIDDTRTGTDPAIPTGTAYETVTVSIGGTTYVVPKHGQPPIGSTGDIFEDSLIQNDVSDPGNVVFSVDDNVHAIPSVNKFRIGDTKHRDSVIVIRTIETTAVIVGKRGLYRLSTLPRPIDTSFTPERVKAKVGYAHGGVSPMAAALFDYGEGLRLAYVSPYGVNVTDGFTWDVVTDDADWESEVNQSALSTAVLINNPRMYRLELYYPSPGSTRPDRCMFLHYHPSHAKSVEGSWRSKATWPVRRDANAAFVARIGGVDIVFSCNANGKVYQHDTGNSEPVVAGGIQFKIETGEVAPNGFGQETRLENLHLHHQTHSGQTADLYFIERAAGEDDCEVRTSGIDLTRRESTPTFKQGLAEAFIFGCENSDALGAIGVDYFVVNVAPSGQTKEP